MERRKIVLGYDTLNASALHMQLRVITRTVTIWFLPSDPICEKFAKPCRLIFARFRYFIRQQSVIYYKLLLTPLTATKKNHFRSLPESNAIAKLENEIHFVIHQSIRDPNGLVFNLHKQLKVERKTIHFLGIINLLLASLPQTTLLAMTVNYYYLRCLSDEAAETTTTPKTLMDKSNAKLAQNMQISWKGKEDDHKMKSAGLPNWRVGSNVHCSSQEMEKKTESENVQEQKLNRNIFG